jgi:carbonic anhydrase
MNLDDILERNRAFVRGREARPLGPAEALPLAVVACYDPRLDSLISASLGLEADRAFLFRTAGASIKPDGTVMRSLALAVFLFGVRDVVVLGHTSCRMAAFDTAGFIDAFRKRGVSRDAFGGEDLRVWAGALPDPRRGVAQSVASIHSAPFLPKDLVVAGLVLDDTTGALEVVVQPGERVAVPPVEETAPPVPAEPHDHPAHAPEPEIEPEIAAAPADPLAEAVQRFVHTVGATGRWREELARLRQDVAVQKNPLAKIGILERFAKKVGNESREARDAFARVQREANVGGRLRDPRELLRLFQDLTGKPGPS